tara:strand:+ start:858 stop:1613 length:756 start_codon:yes stop_codon:yes gene_type:complete
MISMDTDKNKGKSSFLELIKTLFYAGFIAVIFRSLLFEPFNIPSGSMIPSLLVGDYLFVSKYSYGYSKYSFPFGIIPIKDRIFVDEPKRGDIIVFRKPGEEHIDYIKRLIGIPGDRVQVLDGILVVNGKKAIRSKTNIGKMRNQIGNFQLFNEYIEKFEDSQAHRIIESSDNDYFDNTIEFKVPDGHYFFMGDNRDNSRDSRTSEVGFVPRANLIGKAERIFFSHNGFSSFFEFWKWHKSIRFSRIGKKIE